MIPGGARAGTREAIRHLPRGAAGRRGPAAARPALALLLALLGASGCRLLEAGVPLGDGGWADEDGGPALVDAAGQNGPARPDLARPPDPADGAASGPALVLSGPPQQVGCSDGTREGFVELTYWPDIAGCSGGWSVPGALGAGAAQPQCRRTSGNSSENPAGVGCAIADLCAEGWHVCAGPLEVASRSATDCESAVPPGPPLFFLVASAATPFGACTFDLLATNDLHGCGDLGKPELDGCSPLERRMDFAACLATGGVWSCGTYADHLNEAHLVTKRGPSQGGALCCRTP
jgi:hypothetical protein